MRTQSQIIELLISALPYPNQIKNIELSHRSTEVRFEWRGHKFSVTESLHVNEIEDSCLVGNDLSILLRQCLNQAEALKGA